ncbi:MAG: hypothetical protein ACI9VR_002816 [Cognaticolwellia sp.]|jgi:hypothetical protein
MVILFILALACDKDDTGQDSSPEPEQCAPLKVVVTETWASAALRGASDVAGEPWEEHPNFAGPGLAALDLNGDGYLDLAIADPTGPARVLMGGADGFSLGDAVVPQGHGIAAADLTADGIEDLVLARWEGSPDLMGRSDGAGDWSWEEIPETLGHGLSWSFADSDGDGDLDAFAARHLEMVNDEEAAAGRVSGPGSWIYENRNGGELVATPQATPEPTHGALGFMGQWLDADGDNDLDLYMANDFGAWVVPNALLLNDGTGNFIDSGDATASAALYAMGVGVADVDANGRPDLYISNIGSPLLILNQGAWVNSGAALGAELPPTEQRQSSWGVDLVDLDLDGLPEAALRFGPLIFWMEVPYVEDSTGQRWADADSQADALLLNSAEGYQVSDDFQSTEVGRAVIHGDWDRDGDPDLATTAWTEDGALIQIYETQGGCPGGVTVKAPIGTRVTGPKGSQWVLPATTFSSSAAEVYLTTGQSEGLQTELEVQLPGSSPTTTSVRPGQIVDLR